MLSDECKHESLLPFSHNMHHFTQFFKAIQLSISQDTLPDLIEIVQDQKQNHDIEAERIRQHQASEVSDENEANAVLKKIKIDAE